MKNRIVKSPSQCPIPDDAPDWTYKSDSQTATATVHVSQTLDHELSTRSSGTPQRNPTGGQ